MIKKEDEEKEQNIIQEATSYGLFVIIGLFALVSLLIAVFKPIFMFFKPIFMFLFYDTFISKFLCRIYHFSLDEGAFMCFYLWLLILAIIIDIINYSKGKLSENKFYYSLFIGIGSFFLIAYLIKT